MKNTDYWQTPKHVYSRSWFDPCPSNPTFNGLVEPWTGDVFCNPPYSEIEKWIDKALSERIQGRCGVIALLLPNWTDRAWFQKISHCDIFFSAGRLSFLDPNTGESPYNPRFGSMIVFIP